jgi:hypothetical protein
MLGGDFDSRMRRPDGARAFVISCVAVFVVIAACAAYFVVRMLA